MISTIARRLHNNHKNHEQLASKAEMGDAKAAEAFERGQKSRSRGRVAVVALGGTTLVATAAIGLKGLDKATEGLKSIPPHDITQTDVSNTLTEVKVSNKTLLIEGSGRATAKVNVRSVSDAPVVGGLYNGTIGRLTDRTATATRQGKVQLGADRGAIALDTYKLPAKSATGLQWGVRATVQSEGVFSQTTHMRNTGKDGGQSLSAKNDFLSFPSDNGTIRRGGVAGEVADGSFRNACGNAITGSLPGGVESYVDGEIGRSAELLESMPGQQQNADLLKKLAEGPIKVVFAEANGSPVAASDIVLPPAGPSPEHVANGLDVSPEDLRMSAGADECKSTGSALQDQFELMDLQTPEDKTGL